MSNIKTVDLQECCVKLTFFSIFVDKKTGCLYELHKSLNCVFFVSSRRNNGSQRLFAFPKKRGGEAPERAEVALAHIFGLWIKQHTQHLPQTPEQFIYCEIIRNDGRLGGKKRAAAEEVTE